MSTNEEFEEPPSKKSKLQKDPPVIEEQPSEMPKDKGTQRVEEDASNPKYENFVTPEELHRLKEFTVLDEVRSNDEDSNDEESDSSDGKSEGLPEEEIDKMLEEDLPEGFKGAPQPKAKPYITRQKIVLEEKGVNHWESLPLDWMMVRHYSGMPVYMHRTTRVCTLSKPYFLGRGNTRRHDIPISAIPCLAYRKALEEEKKQSEIDKKIEEQIKNGTWEQNDAQQNQSNVPTNSEKNDSEDSNIIAVNEVKGDGNISSKSKCPFIAKTCKEKEEIDEKNSDSDTKHISVVDNASVKELKGEEQFITSNDDKESILTEIMEINDDIKESIDTELSKKIDAKIESITSEICKVNDSESVSDLEEGEIGADNETDNVENCGHIANDAEEPKVTQTNDEAKEGEGNKTSENVEVPLRKPVVLAGGVVVPAPKVENINTSWKTQQLSHEQLNDYCKTLFQFKTVNIMHFNRWEDRRKYTKYTKARKTLQYPTLPDGTKLITIPAPNGQTAGGKPVKRDWVMNMDGRSYLSVFHEYVRRALQKHPVYEFVQLENAATPYQATVYIGGMQYGVGHGSSKRQAKSAAARASIQILIPEMKDDDLDKPASKEPDFSFFDQVGIEDPRISEFCAATCEPSPHAILRTCLLRNFGASDRHIHTEMKKLELQKIELTMKVGKHTATVVCKNKKTAKQRASQAILQALHPHVRSWGSLLRLYGSRSVKSCKQRKLEEQQITLLQDQARHNQPNRAVLAKLRAEMAKLRARDRAIVPIGTLLLEDALPEHSGSNLNNVDL